MIATLPDPAVLADLPSSADSRRRYVAAVVELLDRRGMIDAEFFVALSRERPRRAHEVGDVVLALVRRRERTAELRGVAGVGRPRRWSRTIAAIVVVGQVLALCEFGVAGALQRAEESGDPARDEAVRTVVHESAWRMGVLHASIRRTVETMMALVAVDEELAVVLKELHRIDAEAQLVASALDLAVELVGPEAPRAEVEVGGGRAQERPKQLGSPRRTPPPRAKEPGRVTSGPWRARAAAAMAYEEQVPVALTRVSAAELQKMSALYRSRPQGPEHVVTPGVKPSAVSRRSGVVTQHVAVQRLPSTEELQRTATARRNPHDGVTVASYCVGTDGRVTTVRTIERFPGDPEVDRLFREAVAKWAFVPVRDERGAPASFCAEAKFNVVFAR